MSHPDATTSAGAPHRPGPTLEQGAGNWVGYIPELGRVIVTPRGRVVARPTQRTSRNRDSVGQRERALRLGWGEPLGFARRGFRLAMAAAAGPSDSGRCMLLHGDSEGLARVVPGLCAAGWKLVADQPCPLARGGAELHAHPREAPMVMTRELAETAGLSWAPVRGDSDAVWVDLPRAAGRREVAALLWVLPLPAGEAPGLRPLVGLDRFEFVTSMMIGGVLGAPLAGQQRSPGADLAEHRQLASLPAARLFLGTAGATDLDRLIQWWQEWAG